MKWLWGYQGRINRAKYWGGSILIGLVYFFGFFIALGMYKDALDESTYKTLLMLGTYVFPSIVLSPIFVKRLHDLSMSHWWVLATPIPIVNLYPNLMMAFARGKKGPNQYGPDPLATGKEPEPFKVAI